jgi:hypothetical protein
VGRAGWAVRAEVALAADGNGGYVLDAYGAVHAFGGAPGVTVSAQWPGWDIARAIKLTARRRQGRRSHPANAPTSALTRRSKLWSTSTGNPKPPLASMVTNPCSAERRARMASMRSSPARW